MIFDIYVLFSSFVPKCATYLYRTVDGKADAPCKVLFAMRKSYQTCRDRRKVHVRALLIVGTGVLDGPKSNDHDPNKIGTIFILSPVYF